MNKSPTPAPPRPRQRSILASFAVSLGLAMTAGLIAGCAGRTHFLLDLASHFYVYQAVGISIATVGLVVLKHWRWAGFFLLVALLSYSKISPYVSATPETTSVPRKQHRTLLTINVLTSNRNHEAVIDYVLTQDADIVILQETDQAWVTAITNGLGGFYPYRMSLPRSDNFGMMLLSKTQLENEMVSHYSHFVPSLEADVVFPKLEKSIRVIATHPLPPTRPASWADRNEVFEEIAVSVRERNSADILVAGDLNCSPWSPCFTRFLHTAGLTDSGQGFGISNTWYSGRLPWLGLSIDHVLLGKNMGCISRTIGPNIGSDHRPVRVVFGIQRD